MGENSNDYPDDPMGISGDELCLRNEVERLRADNERLEQLIAESTAAHQAEKRRLERAAADARAASNAEPKKAEGHAADTLTSPCHAGSILTALGPLRDLLNAISDVSRETEGGAAAEQALFLATALELCAAGAETLSKLEPADGRHLAEQFDLLERINLALDPHSEALERRRIQLSVTVDDAVPQYVIGDPLRLEQRLSNLIGAQVKRLAEGDELSVTVRPDPKCAETKQWVEFLISGNFRSDGRASAGGPAEPGDQFVCDVCEVSGGKLRFNAKLGAYARFEFLSLLESAVERASDSSAVGARGGKREPLKRSLRVLLAEDSGLNQRLVASILQRRGHQVEIAENGLEAIAKFDEASYDMVITDIQMPEMDGFQLTSEIRLRDHAAGKHTPIIASTIRALRGDRALCLSSGMDGYIAKPIHPDELITLVEETVWGLSRGCES